MAVELLSENVDSLHGKWNKILEENRPLEKYYSTKLAEMINKSSGNSIRMRCLRYWIVLQFQ